jgi:hypothetical protein
MARAALQKLDVRPDADQLLFSLESVFEPPLFTTGCNEEKQASAIKQLQRLNDGFRIP